MRRRTLASLIMATAAAVGGSAAASNPSINDCLVGAGERYQVAPLLLWSIAKTESGFKPHAINRNTNGTRDIGVMQVNSVWLPKLATFGITEQHLFEPCLNVYVGAWILAQGVQRHGYNWQALSVYNTGHPTRGKGYAAKVLGIAHRSAR